MEIRTFVPDDIKSVTRLCQLAFSGPPWFMQMSDDEIAGRWASYSSYENFNCLVAELSDTIVGAIWFHEMTKSQIEANKSSELSEWLGSSGQPLPYIWIEATFTNPSFQGQGIARLLKEHSLRLIKKSFPGGTILTRMRDDNQRIMHLNHEMGFRKTCVSLLVDSGSRREYYWFLPIDDINRGI